MDLVAPIKILETPKVVHVKFEHEAAYSEYATFSEEINKKINNWNGLWHYNYELNVPSGIDAILISQFIDGGYIFINGVKASQLPTSTKAVKYLWYRPHLVYIPEHLRKIDQATKIQIQSSSYLKYLYLMPVYAGKANDIQLLNDIFSFISRTLSLASSLVALAAGILLMLTWRINKHDRLFFYAGLSAIAWACLYCWLNTPAIPSKAAEFSRLIMYILIGVSLYNLMQYLILLGQSTVPKGYRLFLFFTTISGPLIFIASSGMNQKLIDTYWIGLVFIACIPAVAAFIRHIKLQSKGFNKILGLILIFALTTAYKDYQLIGYEEIITNTRQMLVFDFILAPLFSSYLVMPVVFIFSAGRLIEKYKDSLTSIHQHNIELATALQRNELRLNITHFENIQKREREITELTRAAIHRDLHDGIGSRLVATTYALRAGKLTRDKLEESLLKCLKDIRLIMQSETEQDTRSLQNLLFDYLSDMEEILSGTGVKFTYSIPEDRDFIMLGNRSIEILRMIQEILSNALKHSSARKIYIQMELSDSLLSLKIMESEFDSSSVPLATDGKVTSTLTGLNGLEVRAQSIGAVFLQKSTDSARTSLIAIKLIVDRCLYLPDQLPTGKDQRRTFLTSQISELTDS